MLRKSLAALLVALAMLLPAQSTYARGHGHGHHASSHRGHVAHTGSHRVTGYYRKNGTYVRPHMAGNPGSGNHWHLNHDGSDTLTRPNGSQTTIPSVPNH